MATDTQALLREARQRATVFDDGTDGADAESARSVVAMLDRAMEAAAEAMPEPVAYEYWWPPESPKPKSLCYPDDIRGRVDGFIRRRGLYAAPQPAVPVVPEGWKIERTKEASRVVFQITSNTGHTLSLYRVGGSENYPANVLFDLCEAMLAASTDGEAGDK